ncbi:MAG: DNA-processing protein DprA, partial [Bdellovibrionales bacterium]|nr:DNA-processing protein DprA [Bdellovibrionales bacterium]
KGSLTELFSEEEIFEELKEFQKLQRHGIVLVSAFDATYPQLLRQLYSPPLVLYLRGNTQLLSHAACIAIVGSRNADLKGCQYAHAFSNKLSLEGACVVSGLALGIDGAAHRGALENNRQGSTIAVLGNGLPSIYPASHRELGNQILEQKGLLISPFPPGAPALRHHFLYRNQIIAGLSHGGLIIQAGERSGSLSTARHLLENGREVYVLPGEADNPRYRGSLSLIKQGAQLVISAADIQLPQTFMKESKEASSNRYQLSISQALLRDYLLEHGEQSVADLEDGLQIENVALELCQLELDGLINVTCGNIVSWIDEASPQKP